VLNRKLAQEGTSSILFGRDTKESDRLHKSWRRSRFCKDVDKILSGEQLGPGDDTSPRTDDEDSEPEGEQLGLQEQLSTLPPEDEIPLCAQFVSPHVLLPIQQSSSIPYNATEIPPSLHQRPAEVTHLPGSTWRLLEVYFAYTQSWLPICEKHDMLKVSYSYPEAGLVLSSSDLSNHGDHAELWSVLAVASHQERMVNKEQEGDNLHDPARLYSMARSLIPTESGSFSVGHVRALLNLAVVNLASGNTEVAWLLVGSASRILIVVERSSQTTPPRWKHLLTGCFVLDSFLSLHLQRRPYLLNSDAIKFGPIEEDGLEEWQPWSAPLNSPSSFFSRTPALGLSSFNNLVELVEVLNMCNLKGSASPQSSPQQILYQLESWKGSLSTKFNYISDELKTTPLNPPAILLQLTYLSCVSSLLTSPTHIQRMLELLTQHLAKLGNAAVPPVVICLLAHVQANRTFATLDPRLQSSVRRHKADFIRAWSSACDQRSAPTPPVPAQTRAAYQMPTPESIQVTFNSTYTPLENHPRGGRQIASASLLDNQLPDTDPAISTSHHPAALDFMVPSAKENTPRPAVPHRNSVASRDLETFFDELASLDGAEMVDNQPQFMQNLGFAPDADMADFLALELGQYIPADSGAFMPPSNDPTHLDPVFFDGT
jgi:hypothetical protein